MQLPHSIFGVGSRALLAVDGTLLSSRAALPRMHGTYKCLRNVNCAMARSRVTVQHPWQWKNRRDVAVWCKIYLTVKAYGLFLVFHLRFCFCNNYRSSIHVNCTGKRYYSCLDTFLHRCKVLQNGFVSKHRYSEESLPTLADRITQSIYRLPTSWKVQLCSPCGAKFSMPCWPTPEAHPTSCTMGTEFFSGVIRPQRGAGCPRLNVGFLMVWSCTFAFCDCLCMSWVTLTLASEDLPWPPVRFRYASSFVDCSWSPCCCVS